jgi:hypothetical protein
MANTDSNVVPLYSSKVVETTVGEKVMDELWVSKPIRLKFLLGEIPLFTVKLPALVYNAHFSNLTSDPDKLQPPFERFSSGLEAILVRSHPVERELTRLDSSARAIRYVPSQYQRYYINLEGSFTDYLGKFSAKSRSTLQRKVRKFAE